MGAHGPHVVLFLNTPVHYDADTGTYSTDMVNLLDFFLANSHRFERLTFVVPVGEGRGEVELDLPDNVAVVGFDYYMGPFGLLKRAHRIVPQLVGISLSDEIRQCDAVGAVAPSTLGTFSAPVARLLRDKPTFFIMRGLKHQTVDHSFADRPFRRRFLSTVVGGFESVTKLVLRRDRTHLFTVGEYGDRLAERGYPPESVTSLFPLVSDDIVREERTVRPSATDVLYVGRRSGEKGVADLLTAFADADLDSDGTLHVVGDGPEREPLEARARSLGVADRTVFHGFVGHGDALWTLVDDGDLLVLPSYTEGLPRVLGEGMARGLPTVATRVGGIPAFVDDGENGLLVDPGDVAGLRRAIERVVGDAALRARLTEASLETAGEVTFEAQGAVLCRALHAELLPW
jgi:glycosyltransferase involved in cell wall biosynthesis